MRRAQSPSWIDHQSSLSLRDQVSLQSPVVKEVLISMFEAAFGGEINDPILGYVIPLSSFTVPCSSNQSSLSDPPANTGCPKLCISGPNEPESSETWIALVQRGSCEFVKKVREAQRLGARAVVVGGEDPAVTGYPDALVNMYSPGTTSFPESLVLKHE